MLHKTLNIRGTLTSLDTPLVMGILNVTPDSFYADSRKQTEAAIDERIQAILSEEGRSSTSEAILPALTPQRSRRKRRCNVWLLP